MVSYKAKSFFTTQEDSEEYVLWTAKGILRRFCETSSIKGPADVRLTGGARGWNAEHSWRCR